MKKLLSAAIVLFICTQLFSQNKKGNWMPGVYIGSAGLSFGNSENSVGSGPASKSDNNSFNIGVGPTIGYYITDNVVVGTYFALSYYHGKTDYGTSENTFHYTYFSLGPYGRFYFGKNNGKGMPFVQLNAGISFYPGYKSEFKSPTGSSSSETKDYHPLSAGAQFGYEHFMNAVIGIQYYIGYSYNHSDYKSVYHSPPNPDITYNYKNNSHTINFGVGLVIHLDCRKK